MEGAEIARKDTNREKMVQFKNIVVRFSGYESTVFLLYRHVDGQKNQNIGNNVFHIIINTNWLLPRYGNYGQLDTA